MGETIGVILVIGIPAIYLWLLYRSYSGYYKSVNQINDLDMKGWDQDVAMGLTVDKSFGPQDKEDFEFRVRHKLAILELETYLGEPSDINSFNDKLKERRELIQFAQRKYDDTVLWAEDLRKVTFGQARKTIHKGYGRHNFVDK